LPVTEGNDLLLLLARSVVETLRDPRTFMHADAPDYADAHDLVLTLLDELRSIDLDHPDTRGDRIHL
jgi:hypothetical protein